MSNREQFQLEQEVSSQWHVEGLMSRGLCMLAGHPGSAKSIFSKYIAWCSAYEQECLDLPTRWGPVVLLNNDHSQEQHESWISRFCEGVGLPQTPVHQFVAFHHQFTNLTSSGDGGRLHKVFSEVKPVLLVIDRFSSTIGADEDKSRWVEPFSSLLRGWAQEFELSCLLIHHLTKEPTQIQMDLLAESFSRRLRGSSAILGMCDTAIELINLTPEETRMRFFGVRPHPKRHPVLSPFKVQIIETAEKVRLQKSSAWLDAGELEELSDFVRRLFDRGVWLNTKEVEERLAWGYDIKDVRLALRLLVKKKELVFVYREARGKFLYTTSDNARSEIQFTDQDQQLIELLGDKRMTVTEILDKSDKTVGYDRIESILKRLVSVGMLRRSRRQPQGKGQPPFEFWKPV